MLESKVPDPLIWNVHDFKNFGEFIRSILPDEYTEVLVKILIGINMQTDEDGEPQPYGLLSFIPGSKK